MKRRRPPALVLDGYASDGTSSAVPTAGPSRLTARQDSRRSSTSTGEPLVNTYGTRSRVPTADTSTTVGAGAGSRASSRSPAKRDAEAPSSAKRSARGNKKRDLASQFAEKAMQVDEIAPQEEEEEESAEKSTAKTQEMEEMWERWNEEYFESESTICARHSQLQS